MPAWFTKSLEDFKNNVEVTESMSDKLTKCRCAMLTREPWYGSFAIGMKWTPRIDPELTAMGVRITRSGGVECIYSPHFVNNIPFENLYGVIKHEIEHIVRLHCIRGVRHTKKRAYLHIEERNTAAWYILGPILHQFTKALEYLNKDLPTPKGITLDHYDMFRGRIYKIDNHTFQTDTKYFIPDIS